MPSLSSVRWLVPSLVSFIVGIGVGIALGFPIQARYCQFQYSSDEKRQPLRSSQSRSTSESNELEEEQPLSGVPDNAPAHCPGVESRDAGKSGACAGCPNRSICASGEAKRQDPAPLEVKEKLATVKRKILVLSGKGGVGKSTVSCQLSWALQDRGFQVGLLDIDVCGPSIPMMTGCKGASVHASADGWSPVFVGDGLAVMSMGFLLSEEDRAVVWRGPRKNGLILQFLSDVTWGELDILIVDTPPGTSDEHLSIVTYLKEAGIDGAIVVTTPQEASLQDVRKEINFCKLVKLPVLAVIENMTSSIFDSQNADGAKQMCDKMDVPYGGRIPLDCDLLRACETGKSLASINPNSAALMEFDRVIDETLLKRLKLDQN